mmetsp:Transcript_13086/g.31024  ORF Transcript_13086/g.31024 Transcript_13086/m.31024 type:complete len:98 (+) Transcript_13086:108-401(+)|eukprot:CAMPEP_0177590816 /NCGR_PEP_ID=MMETSP0419_2-20121207/7633_1 /TAXON_ID=582737 /ORGANISM="Tetraselmis sp., Strain GSL018" /LENGTH=97 /DNA_ID=CAMNT_0019081451 /DNA_START=93 /DNA_END=386 /DNA_ORIENTATION=-
MASADISHAQARLEDLKKQVEAEGGEISNKPVVVGQENNRLQDVLEKERLKKEKLAAKRAERDRKKKEAKGIVDEEPEEEEDTKSKKGKKKKNKNAE